MIGLIPKFKLKNINLTRCKTKHIVRFRVILQVTIIYIHNIIELRINNQVNNYQDWIQRIVFFTCERSSYGERLCGLFFIIINKTGVVILHIYMSNNVGLISINNEVGNRHQIIRVDQLTFSRRCDSFYVIVNGARSSTSDVNGIYACVVERWEGD